MCKVVENPNYEASTPNEIFFDNRVKEIFEEIYTDIPEDMTKEELWKQERVRVYVDVIGQMLELRWIDDSEF